MENDIEKIKLPPKPEPLKCRTVYEGVEIWPILLMVAIGFFITVIFMVCME